jgi:hypothetical protein
MVARRILALFLPVTAWSTCGIQSVSWPLEGGGVHCEDANVTVTDAIAFLESNMPSWDLQKSGSVISGVIEPTASLAVSTKQALPWAASVPRDTWFDYVLPYASVDEARSNWRQFLSDVLLPLVQNRTDLSTLSEVALYVNGLVWEAARPQGKVVFKSEQTPLIYDPMSTLVFGYASCTGISILYVDALRAVGVPARLVGTPAWHGNVNDGNHNWVEIWTGSEWAFQEGSPAGGGESLTNPCDKWYCNPSHFDGKTQVFAAHFDRHSSDPTTYPMAWDLGNTEVPGVNRTEYYTTACAVCGTSSVTA